MLKVLQFNHWLIFGRIGYVFSNLSCGQVNVMAIVIGLHGNVCCLNNTGRVTLLKFLFIWHSAKSTGCVKIIYDILMFVLVTILSTAL